MEHRQTLAELIKNDEHPALMPKMYGHIQATLFDTKTGRIKQQISQKNLVTAAYFTFASTYQNLASLYIMISNDTEDPHYYKHFCNNTFQDTSLILDTRDLDYPNKTYTYLATFTGVTAPGRTVSLVNLATGTWNHDTYVNTAFKSFTSVKLNSSIYQTPSDSLEIVYRLSFVRV